MSAVSPRKFSSLLVLTSHFIPHSIVQHWLYSPTQQVVSFGSTHRERTGCLTPLL